MAKRQIDYESIRANPPVGVISIWRAGFGVIPLLSYHFVDEAYSATESVISEFETRGPSGINVNVLTSVGLWFWALESAVSCCYKTVSPKVLKPISLVEKFKNLPGLLGSTSIPSKQLVNELAEFCTFRNRLFHDLYRPADNTRFSHTRFSLVPAYANEIDLMEAMRIALNCIHFYRYFITGVDLLDKKMASEFNQNFIPRMTKAFSDRDFLPVRFENITADICSVQTEDSYQPVIYY